MLSNLILGLEYGLLAASTVGSFLVCIALVIPVIVLAYTLVGLVLSIGGNKHE